MLVYIGIPGQLLGLEATCDSYLRSNGSFAVFFGDAGSFLLTEPSWCW